MLKSASFLVISLLVAVTVCANKSVVYYGNWDVYHGYPIESLPAEYITHLIYAFADLYADGSTALSDPAVDVQNLITSSSMSPNFTTAVKRVLGPKSVMNNSSASTPTVTVPGVSPTPSRDLEGNLAQLFTLKKTHRSMKTLLSFGGWNAGSANFSAVAGDPRSRDYFAQSALQMMEDYGFDGLDIDWEYPETATDANNYLLLLKSVRAALNDRSAATNQRYLLSTVGAAGQAQMQYLTSYLSEIADQVDFWNVLAFDFAGDFSTVTAHASNFRSAQNNTTPFSGSAAFDNYVSNQVPSQKLVLGCPTYGHSFCQTNGLGFPFSPCLETADGIIQAGGVVPYKDLPLPNALSQYSGNLVAAWSEDASIRQIISYEDQQSIGDKIKASNFSGIMWWRAATDKVGEQSLIKTAFEAMNDLDLSQNNLNYPNSNFSLIRSGGNSSIATYSTVLLNATNSLSSNVPMSGQITGGTSTLTTSSQNSEGTSATSTSTDAAIPGSSSESQLSAQAGSTSGTPTQMTPASTPALSELITFTITESLRSETTTITSTAVDWTSHIISITEIFRSSMTTVYTLVPGAGPSESSSNGSTDLMATSASSFVPTQSSSVASASTNTGICGAG